MDNIRQKLSHARARSKDVMSRRRAQTAAEPLTHELLHPSDLSPFFVPPRVIRAIAIMAVVAKVRGLLDSLILELAGHKKYLHDTRQHDNPNVPHELLDFLQFDQAVLGIDMSTVQGSEQQVTQVSLLEVVSAVAEIPLAPIVIRG